MTQPTEPVEPATTTIFRATWRAGIGPVTAYFADEAALQRQLKAWGEFRPNGFKVETITAVPDDVTAAYLPEVFQ
ncbi:hypothetical protein [Actinoplanes sp. NPDC026670]|uniref:hypothetical protein n=1 Tax=Actinoplanes sp. NPDC026670 TaxID=3154700 RepID=UPI00340FED80